MQGGGGKGSTPISAHGHACCCFCPLRVILFVCPFDTYLLSTYSTLGRVPGAQDTGATEPMSPAEEGCQIRPGSQAVSLLDGKNAIKCQLLTSHVPREDPTTKGPDDNVTGASRVDTDLSPRRRRARVLRGPQDTQPTLISSDRLAFVACVESTRWPGNQGTAIALCTPVLMRPRHQVVSKLPGNSNRQPEVRAPV